jgi:hypothetical protein
MQRFSPAMASIAGPRIAEIKVRHHARQFGTSKYGLSRIYRVLLDLLVIKTVASFTSRPLLWFTILSVPMLVGSAIAFSYTAVAALTGDHTFSLSIAGTGLILMTAALILLSNGALAEMVYKLGDLREHEFAQLTQRIRSLTPANH